MRLNHRVLIWVSGAFVGSGITLIIIGVLMNIGVL